MTLADPDAVAAGFVDAARPRLHSVGAADSGCPRCGRDACEGCSRLRSAVDVMRDRPPDEVVEGIVWADSVTVLVSESGCGKTFVTLGLAAAVTAGSKWCGRDVQVGSVAYVSFEGDALGLRLRAIADTQGHTLADLYLLMRATEPLSPHVNRDGAELAGAGELSLVEELAALRKRLASEGRPPIVLLVVDTARASMSGDEDRSGDVAAYLRAVRRVLAGLPGAGCIVVHHAGWQDGDTKRKRERGSSAWRGNVDATLYLELTEEAEHCAYLTLTAAKVRDGERPAPLRLIRRRVDVLGTDRRGQPLSSCIVERDPRTMEAREQASKAAELEAQLAVEMAVLKAISDHKPTNRDSVRLFAGARRDAVYAALDRVLRDRLATQRRRGEAFTLTKAGKERLQEPIVPSSPIVPSNPRDDGTRIVPPSPPIGGRGRSSPRRGRKVFE